MVIHSSLGNNGRLGNQLFQIATTIGYAIDNGLKHEFPEWKYNQYLENKIPVSTQNGLQKYIYTKLEYKEIPHYNNVDLFGYFQSEKYFSKHKDIILNQFKLKKEYLDYILNKYQFLLQNDTCSIHIRRGDYLQNTNFYNQLGTSYYNNAANIIGSTKTFVICSDDIQWCKSNLQFANCEYIENEIDIIDMYIMSLCKHNIIANSSFSWWSAYLNTNKDKMIVTPKQWFVNNKETSKDINPESWIKI